MGILTESKVKTKTTLKKQTTLKLDPSVPLTKVDEEVSDKRTPVELGFKLKQTSVVKDPEENHTPPLVKKTKTHKPIYVNGGANGGGANKTRPETLSDDDFSMNSIEVEGQVNQEKSE